MALTSILSTNLYKIVTKAPKTCVLQAGFNAVGMQRFYGKKPVYYWPYPLNQKNRQENELPMNPNAYGPLTDGPDFSYLDGRPGTPGIRQFKRMLKQQELAQKVVQLCGEMDFAVQRHERMKIEKQEERKRILDNKLKPKGKLLLKKE